MRIPNSCLIVLVLMAALASSAVAWAQGTSYEDYGSGGGQSSDSTGSLAEEEIRYSAWADQFEAFVEAIRAYFGFPAADDQHEAFAYGLDVHVAAMTYLAMNVRSQPEDVVTDDCTGGYVIGDQAVDAPETELRSCRIVWQGGLDFVVEVVTADGATINAPPDASDYPYH